MHLFNLLNEQKSCNEFQFIEENVLEFFRNLKMINFEMMSLITHYRSRVLSLEYVTYFESYSISVDLSLDDLTRIVFFLSRYIQIYIVFEQYHLPVPEIGILLCWCYQLISSFASVVLIQYYLYYRYYFSTRIKSHFFLITIHYTMIYCLVVLIRKKY